MTQHDVKIAVDLLEKFILSVIRNEGSPDVSDAVTLNKHREVFQAYLGILAGATEEHINPTTSFDCPDCGGEMLLRTNRQNGDKFWGCKKYPECRGTRDSSGLSREERKAKQDSYEQQSGFSFNKKRDPANEVGP